jgi:hypothetical protein
VKILKAMVILSNDDGTGGAVNSMDAIEHDGRIWLVPEWFDYKDAKVTMPVRIVCLDLIPHQRGTGTPEIVVDGPLPRSVVEGRCPPGLKARYLVIEKPDIRLPLRTVH